MTKTVATLGPSVRLVVFKFLIRNKFVPDCIPRLPINHSGIMPAARGKEIFPSTPAVYLGELIRELFSVSSNYKFVGARVAGERGDGKYDVRFTFCHHKHLNSSPSHPNFEKLFTQLYGAFRQMTEDNLWSVQAYLNPYLLDNGKTSKDSVLMFNCTGRRQTVNPDGSETKIWTARDGLGQGVGPRISLFSTAGEISLAGKRVLYSSVR